MKYAKGHYGKTNYFYNDLSTLITKWSGWHPEEVKVGDILHCVYSVWKDFATSSQSIILDLFHGKTEATTEEAIKTMLQHLRWVKNDLLPANYADVFFGNEEEKQRIKESMPFIFDDYKTLLKEYENDLEN